MATLALVSDGRLTTAMADEVEPWPSLELAAWEPTYATLHLWSQMVGKTRLALSPPVNHWWHVALYLSPRGLTTGLIPYGRGGFEVEFDFIAHQLVARTSAGTSRTIALVPRTVADFYGAYLTLLSELGIAVRLTPKPCELPDPILFPEDRVHAAYDADYANRFWRVLVQVDRVLKEFRGRFIGKASPSHFFWGSFDLAATRYSGRRAPERPGADMITREAYSHECISAGFWPGSGPVREAAFYAYAFPEPAGLADAKITPADAYYHRQLGEFILPYEAVRSAKEPDAVLRAFLTSTYDAAATLGLWDRAALERT
jgi:hypothetical protein